MNCMAEDGRIKRGGRRIRGEVHSKKTWKRWVSAGKEPAGSPVTETDGDFSSPMLRESKYGSKRREKVDEGESIGNRTTNRRTAAE